MEDLGELHVCRVSLSSETWLCYGGVEASIKNDYGSLIFICNNTFFNIDFFSNAYFFLNQIPTSQPLQRLKRTYTKIISNTGIGTKISQRRTLQTKSLFKELLSENPYKVKFCRQKECSRLDLESPLPMLGV